MCKILLFVFFLCGLLLTVNPAKSQTPPDDTGYPYGGPPVATASLPPPNTNGDVRPRQRGTKPATSTVACASDSPCVLTGQYDVYRTSVNVRESTLASFSDWSNFGIADFYEFCPGGDPSCSSTLPGSFTFEPAVAQPLYITNVPPDGTNVLFVASLNDYVYLFKTSDGSAFQTPINLATHCGSSGSPFENTTTHEHGAANLVYYGAVATPVIDIAPVDPVAYVVSACTSSWGSTTIHWYLDAIDVQTGADLQSVEITDSTNGFTPSNQLARAALLLTHPVADDHTFTYVYVAFGAGLGELKAAGGTTGATTSEWAYTGALFAYRVAYSGSEGALSVAFSQPLPNFYTSCFTGAASCSTSISPFPNAYNYYDSANPPLGPTGVGGTYDYGDNWAVNGGGIWQSAVGPASTTDGYVYLAAGNGPFGCSGGGPNCTTSDTIYYWGESAMRFPEATETNPMTPADFFAPYVQRYTANMNQGSSPLGDPTPASYQTEELNRLDLDFGSAGVVLIPHTTFFAMTPDKSGYAYVMPAAALGQFRQGDAGLTGGTVTTQVPFQLSRYPTDANQGICPINNDSTWTHTTTSCDEVHEMAFWNDLLVVWPINESVEVYKGTFATSPTTSYTFPVSGTTGNGIPTFDPCLTSGNCGQFLNFPPANVHSGGHPDGYCCQRHHRGYVVGYCAATELGDFTHQLHLGNAVCISNKHDQPPTDV